MSDCCNAYTKWLNVTTNRKGNLFMRPFKRNKITDDAHLAWTVWYIHKNPMHHHYVRNIEDWKFSSYKSVFSSNTKTASKKVVEFFGTVSRYTEFHKEQIEEHFDRLE